LDSQDFDMQANLFKIIMKNNAKYSLMGIAWFEPYNKIVMDLISSHILILKILKYIIKAIKIVV
jgi:hypothetical protein